MSDPKTFKVVISDLENIRPAEAADDEADIMWVKEALESAGAGEVKVTLE